MNEERKDLFENDMEKEIQGCNENTETVSDDSDVNIYERTKEI